MSVWVATALSLVSGVLVGLAFPHPGFFWLAWFGAAPFLFAILQCHRPRRAVWCGICFGYPLFIKTFSFLTIFGGLAAVLAAAYETLYTVLLALALHWLLRDRESFARNVFLVAAVWVAVEWFRTFGPLGVSWADLGYSQMSSLAMIQITSVIGSFGLSYLVALTNAALAERLCSGKAPRLSVALVLALPALCSVFGVVALRTHPESDVGGPEGASVTVVEASSVNTPDQPNRPTAPYQLEVFRRLTLRDEVPEGGLIVWPEAAIGVDVTRDPRLVAGLEDLVRRKNSYLVFGCADSITPLLHHNTAAVLSPTGERLGTHHKNKLIIMGEQVPPWMRKVLGPVLDDYGVPEVSSVSGRGYEAIPAGDFVVAPLICYESLFSYSARKGVANGANLLVIITNDGWFGPTAAGVIHAKLAAVHAVENRTPVARAACTGISQFVDSYGRITQQTGLMNTDDLSITTRIVPRSTDPPGSIYTRVGDLAVWLSLAGIAAAVAGRFVRRAHHPTCGEDVH